MELKASVGLAGKYIITHTLLETEYFYSYISKSPALGEEFIITEFFPSNIASRNEDDFILIKPEEADEFEKKLEKFTSDCNKLFRMSLNRFLHLREVLEDKGTIYVVSKNLTGVPLTQIMLEENKKISFDDKMLKNLYTAISAAYYENITVDINYENTYVEESGSIKFMFNYLFESDEKTLIKNMARLFYSLITLTIYEKNDTFNDLLNKSKFSEGIREILKNNEEYLSFDALNSIFGNKKKKSKKSSFLSDKSYAISISLFVVIIILLFLAVSFGVYQLASLILQ